MDIKQQAITEYLTQGTGLPAIGSQVWRKPNNDQQMGDDTPGYSQHSPHRKAAEILSFRDE